MYEIAPTVVGVRAMENDVLFATNHFVSQETKGMDIQPPATHSTLRFKRSNDLAAAGGRATAYGKLGLESLVKILRDRTNPETNVESPGTMCDRLAKEPSCSGPSGATRLRWRRSEPLNRIQDTWPSPPIGIVAEEA